MLKPPSQDPVFRLRADTTISAVDTLKSSLLPGLSNDAYHCLVCGQVFPRQSVMAEHMQMCHPQEMLFAAGMNRFEYPCQSCDEKFRSNIELDEHIRITHQTLRFTRCTTCGLYGISAINGEYKCIHCGSICHSLGQSMYATVPPPSSINSFLDQQKAMMNSEPKPLTLKLTKAITPITVKQEPKNEVDNNLFVHSGLGVLPFNTTTTSTGSPEKIRHKCPECPKTFKTPATLALHRKIHSGEVDTTPKERPYSCSYCGKCFTQSNTLKQHTRIHTGEKPFRCVYCDKAFSVKDYLTKHIRTHTGEKPYACPYCDKRFTQRSALTVHTTKLHPI